MSQPLLLGLLSVKAVNTLTPIWLLGLGALAGLVLIGILWGLLAVLSRLPGLDRVCRPADEVWVCINEGVLRYILVTAIVLSVLGLAGTAILRPLSESTEILSSLGRLTKVGTTSVTTTVPGSPQPASEDEVVVPPSHDVDLAFEGRELLQVRIASSENIAVSANPEADLDSLDSINVKADEPYKWRKRPNSKSPFGEEAVNTLYVRNRGADEATVEFTVTTDVVYPQVNIIPITAISLLCVFLLYYVQFALMPRLSAVALATYKSEAAQPLFAIIMVLGACSLVLFIYVPYNTFGEDIKMLKDSGLILIRVLCIILAVWSASTTLSDEIEGRTALTVLSKPVRRRSFVVGKFFGIGWTTALMYIILGTVLLAVVSYKLIYDARESAKEIPTWQACYLEMASTAPGLVLGFMETIIFAALAVAMATRLPMFANFMVCFTVYVLGHLIPLISQVTEDRFEIVKFFGQFSAAVFPYLEAFDLQTAVAGGLAVPNAYLAVSLLYCFLFSLVAMLLALILFEDRDLA